MSDRYFLKIDGLNGGSTDPLHLGAFEVESFSMVPARHHVGAGNTGGTDSRITDVVITKRTDPSSTALFHASLNGRVFKQATLTIEKVTFIGIRVKSVVIRMESVMIDAVHPRHGFDEVLLNFDQMRFEKGGIGAVPNQAPGHSWSLHDLRGS